MDKYTFTGNIGQDPTTRTLENGRQAVSFSVAIDKSYTDRNGQKVSKAKWIKCTRWLDAGKNWGVVPYLKKGTKVLIEGEPDAQSWVDNQGSGRADLVVTVHNLELLGGAPQGQQTTQQQQRPAAQQQPPAAQHQQTEEPDSPTDDLPF